MLLIYSDAFLAPANSYYFLTHTAAVSNSMTQVSGWPMSNGYTSAAASEFLGKADAFLVAHAMSGGHES